MFYRQKSYVIKNDFVDEFNAHFINTNLPNQLKYGSRLIGRWMKANNDNTTEIFAIWEYDSYEEYINIEGKIRNDDKHIERINKWYNDFGGRDYVLEEYILEAKNEALVSTVSNDDLK
ncbi:NIPSNAP family protein [Halalkalibacillus halophilus]|uniref:NIPSNAP family protein n=1 Tax=Halalkalibacillus halophilus TaxID=392827 RepID=UPI00040F49B4|nr:NIPSNAP family protein [Halalkalibacillus halophilus]